jgi:hypothetical protein
MQNDYILLLEGGWFEVSNSIFIRFIYGIEWVNLWRLIPHKLYKECIILIKLVINTNISNNVILLNLRYWLMMHYLVYNGFIPESNLLQKKSIANA